MVLVNKRGGRGLVIVERGHGSGCRSGRYDERRGWAW